VFIVTGGDSGVGLALVKILYHAGGKVYIAGRSREKAAQAIDDIKAAASDREGYGQLEFLELDLSDLRTVKHAVEGFKSKETRLDVLWNNAAVSSCPPDSRSAQGMEMQMATNPVGPYLFTELLQPLLWETAKLTPEGSVRVVWTASLVAEMQAPKGG
jgi:NAD(P)-dependent dehydrogenase (short-subunit alcohol dehydrogenase family)